MRWRSPQPDTPDRLPHDVARRSVENGNVNDFFASVKLNRAEERLCLRAVLDLLADETSRSVKAMSPVICDFLSSVSDVDGSLDDLKRFFEDLRDTENFKDFIRSDRAYIYDLEPV